MRHAGFALAIDRRHQPIEIGSLRWSSSETAWAGFPVDSRVLGPRGHLSEFGIEHLLLGLCVAGEGTIQIGRSDAVRRVTSVPGRFSLLNQGFEQKPLTWSGTREVVCVALNSSKLERLMNHDSELIHLVVEPRFAISDPGVVSLVLSMRDEIRAGCPTGRLYGEALSVALSEYLRRRYGRGPAPARGFGQGLLPAQVRRVREYIRSHLGSDIGLAELAEQVNLSPHYFSMLFKQALGVPPHQYVLQERILEAQRQLATGRTPISELAVSLGFSDQSHFSQAFRRITGTTPKRYQSDAGRTVGDGQGGLRRIPTLPAGDMTMA